MKKIVCLIIVLVMTVSCFGCEGRSDKTVYKIGMLVNSIDDDFTEVYAGVISDLFTEREKGDIQYQVTILSSENSHERQLKQVEVYANQQFDVLIVESVAPDKALDLVKAAVALYEVDDEEIENALEDNPADEDANADNSGEDVISEDNIEDSETDETAAGLQVESNPRVDGIYVPNRKEVQIPIVFIGNMPVLEEPAVNDENAQNAENAETESTDNQEPEQEVADTSLCCSITFDKETLVADIELMIKDLPLNGDINGNGTVEYAFVCSNELNDDYKLLIERIANYFSENNIQATETFRYFAQTKDSTFYSKTEENIRKNDGKTDIIFALTDRSLDAIYQLSIPKEMPEPEEGEEPDEQPKVYTIGTYYNVIALGLEENTKNFVQNDIIPKYISYDYIGMAESIVDNCINYIERKDDKDFVQENYVYEYVTVEKEEEKKK